MENKDLNQLIEIIRSSKKYGMLCSDTIKRIGQGELSKYKKFHQAVDSTKRKLHQIYGAYESGLNYTKLNQKLKDAYYTNSESTFRQACQMVMMSHASTRERLPILDDFYSTIFHSIAEPSAIMDLACGLNPLSIPWMNLAQHVRYLAYDINESTIDLIKQFLRLINREPTAFVRDIIVEPPLIKVDVALLLKTFTTLERQTEGFSRALIEALNARYIVVSFPVKSLGGKTKGMIKNYETRFSEVFEAKDWETHKILFDTELVFILDKN